MTLEVCGAIHPPVLILSGRTELESKRWTMSSWGRWPGKGAGSRRKKIVLQQVGGPLHQKTPAPSQQRSEEEELERLLAGWVSE